MSLVLDPPTKPKPVTPEELLAMTEGERYELVNGQLVELPMGVESGVVTILIIGILSRFLGQHPLGHLLSEGTSYRCFGDDTIRKPDVSFLFAGRLNRAILKAGHCPLVPDFVVEVISPRDLLQEMMRKLDDYFAAGIPLVWLVEPETRTVTIYRQGGTSITRLTEQETITGDPVLPGFSCRVAEFFPSAEFLNPTTPSASPA
jgi:Uma2 family endonuclease